MSLLLVDDHKLFREGMRLLLESGLQGGKETAGLSQGVAPSLKIYEAADSESALHLAALHPQLDLVLLDLRIPGSEGLSTLEQFIQDFPVLPVVILSASQNKQEIRQALECGAMGFIPKDSSSSAVVSAIHLVLSGNIYVPPILLQDTFSPKVSSEGNSSNLTERQMDVVRLMARGQSNKEIARALELAETTVKMHVSHIMRTLNVSNRTQAVVKAEKLGLVEQSF